jgi:hypothetical protein
LNSKETPSSLLLPTLPIMIIVLITNFILWSNIFAISEGQTATPSIRITSPSNGQSISLGENLTISGIWTGNTSRSNPCYVSVIVNSMKPYQNATPDGPNGASDYSKWHYNVSTTYMPIKEGQNKITAKLSCLHTGSSGTSLANITNPSNNLVKWNSINVTGVSTSGNQTVSNSTIQQQQKQDRFKAEGNTTATSNGTVITTPHNKNSKSNYNNYISGAKSLSVSVRTSQNIVNGKGTSTVTAIANDAATGKRVENAVVKLKITFTSNGTSKVIVGHNGEVEYSAKIQPNPNNNSNMSYKATVEASAPGYISSSKTTTSSSSSSSFTSKSTETSNSSHEGSIENLTTNILKDVQKKLKANGINATLG